MRCYEPREEVPQFGRGHPGPAGRYFLVSNSLHTTPWRLGFTQTARCLLLGTQGLAPVDPPAGFYSSSPQCWAHFQPLCLHVSLDASSILFTSLTWSSFFLFDGTLGCHFPGFVLWLSKINFVTFLSSSSMHLRWEDEFPMSAQSTKLTRSPSERNM